MSRAEITTPPLRGVVDLFYADDAFRLQLEQTPGSVNGHHAKLGGLLLHLFEVTPIARNTATPTNSSLGSRKRGSSVQPTIAEAE